MKLYSESVEMTNMQWTEVSVKSVVEEGVVDSEVHRRMHFGTRADRSRPLLSGRSLGGRSRLLRRVRERRVLVRGVRIGSKVKSVWESNQVSRAKQLGSVLPPQARVRCSIA